MEFDISYDKNGAILRGKIKKINLYSFDIEKIVLAGNSSTLSNYIQLQRIKPSFFLWVEHSTCKEHNYFGLLKAETHEMILRLCSQTYTPTMDN